MEAKDDIIVKKEIESKCLKICQSNLLDYVLLIKIKRVLSSVDDHSFRLFLTNILSPPSSAIEIQSDRSLKKKINMLWLEIRCYDCVRIRDKLKDVMYSFFAQFDRRTWATVMLRVFSKSNHKVCRLFFARIFANDWRKELVLVSESTCYTYKQLPSCDLEAKYKNSTSVWDNKSLGSNLLLHPIEKHHNKNVTLNINNGANQKMECLNASVNIGKEVNSLKRKRGKEEKKVSLEDITSYISKSFTLKEAAECLKDISVSRSTLKRKCRQLGISQWQPSNERKHFRRTRTLQSKKVSEFSSKLEVASLNSMPSALYGDIVSQYKRSTSTSTTVPKFPSRFEAPSLKSMSLRLDDVNQCRSVCDTPKDKIVPGYYSRLEAAILNSVTSTKDLSQYRTSCGTPKSKKVAEFGSLAQDVSEYNQNLNGCRSLVLFPITYSHAWNKTAANTNITTDERLVVSNEKISSHSFALGQSTSVSSPILQQAEMQDEMTSLIKATYKDDMVRFHFSFKANIMGLKKEVARRLNLKLGTFKMKYLDDEDEWTLLASNLDWHEFIYISRSSRKNAVRLLVQDMQREDDLQTTLLKL